MPTLLVLEDDADTLDAIADLFRREAYNVIPCDSPQAAWAQVTSGPRPDLVLADTMMTGNGRGFAASMKADASLKDVPILLMSANSHISADVVQHVGAVGFLRKPFDNDDLVNRVAQIIAGGPTKQQP